MEVLNAGHIELLEFMGGDAAVIRNARRCWRSEDKSNPKSDANLIRHLLKAGHKTPFEAMTMTFDIKCPIFVARQWMRHRIGSFNEESLRYCEAFEEYYVPLDLPEDMVEFWHIVNQQAFGRYEYALENGIPREQARALLPLGTYTRFYWTVNGSSLINFLNLRLDKHAQKEIREYAAAILELVKEVAPLTFNTWQELQERN